LPHQRQQGARAQSQARLQRSNDNGPGGGEKQNPAAGQAGAAVHTNGDDGVCPTCGGGGFLRRDVPVGHPDFGRLVPCACWKRRRLDDLARRVASWAPALVQLCTWERFRLGVDAQSDHDNVQAFCAAYRFALQAPHVLAAVEQGRVAELVSAGIKPWLLLHGPAGAGKTHLAAAIGNHLVQQGLFVLFAGVPDLLDSLRRSYGDRRDGGHAADLLTRVIQAPVLILDDLGAERETEWVREQLYVVINRRYTGLQPTVFTTNVRLQDLDPRIASRLRDVEVGHQVHLDLPDFRADRGQSLQLLSEETKCNLMAAVTQAVAAEQERALPSSAACSIE
jgi:DNA replication protein DnaC